MYEYDGGVGGLEWKGSEGKGSLTIWLVARRGYDGNTRRGVGCRMGWDGMAGVGRRLACR